MVVTGRAELDSWDQVIEEWRSRGGDDQRRECEEAIAAASDNEG